MKTLKSEELLPIKKVSFLLYSSMDYSKEWFKHGQTCGEKFNNWRFNQQHQIRNVEKREEIFQMFKALRVKVKNGTFKKTESEVFLLELGAIEEKIKDGIRSN